MIEPECHLWGENFHPSALKNIQNIQLRHVNEVGEIGTTGKYKGVSIPYGACCICTPKSILIPKRISWLADFIIKHRPMFTEAGATKITFWIYCHSIQGNMEFTPLELEKIAKLNISLCIDFIHRDEA